MEIERGRDVFSGTSVFSDRKSIHRASDLSLMDRIGATGPGLTDRIGATHHPDRRMNLLDRIEATCGYWDRIGKRPTPGYFGRIPNPTAEALEKARRARFDENQAAAQRRYLTPRK